MNRPLNGQQILDLQKQARERLDRPDPTVSGGPRALSTAETAHWKELTIEHEAAKARGEQMNAGRMMTLCDYNEQSRDGKIVQSPAA